MSTPLRTQYPFAALTEEQKKKIIGLNHTIAYIINIQNQWDTFERIENANDLIYQQYQVGDRSKLYYQFVSDQEFKDYRAGQQWHINAYPNLPIETFQPIRDRPMPDVPLRSTLPYETNIPRFVVNTITPTASELQAERADTEVYTYVSTFNFYHQIKYAFVDDVEKNAYERAELRINAQAAAQAAPS